MQIESMLARGAGIAAIRPIMQDAFSRRALYRHRAKHMSAAESPGARPVPFPHDGSPVERIKWLQREAELTAALAEQRGDLSAKIKTLHEVSRLIWLELRANERVNNDPAHTMEMYREHLERVNQQSEEARARREAAATMTDREAEVLKYFQNTPYRTKDEDMSG